MKKSLKIAFFACAVMVSSAGAFDWPQKEIVSDSFFSYFAQYRGGRISPSLVFSDTGDVKAADRGRLIAYLSEHTDGDIFESTLGNAAIVSHQDEMLTVYANLDSTEFLDEVKDVEAGQFLGETSNSGWQEGNACLEFQVVDTKNKNFVNPRLLMPRFGNEPELEISGITAVNKAGMSFKLTTTNALNAGTYYLYNERHNVAVPYKTMILVNGVAMEALSYDSLYEVDGRLCLKGKNMQNISTVYPNSSRLLVGEVTLPRGRNELTVVISDILGKEKSMTYIFDAR